MKKRNHSTRRTEVLLPPPKGEGFYGIAEVRGITAIAFAMALKWALIRIAGDRRDDFICSNHGAASILLIS
jgi:hypothetical protein